MYAPWRLAFVEGAERDDLPVPSGCIFCDFPLRPGLEVPAPGEASAGSAPREESRRAWDKRRLVVTARAPGFVILNRYPYGNGHVMVVPWQHTDQLESLSEADFLGLHRLLRETIAAVRAAYAPHGLNVGMNMGKAGGAGIDQHIHYHVLPRWSGDVNFMPALFDTKVISEALDDTWERLAALLRRPEDDAA